MAWLGIDIGGSSVKAACVAGDCPLWTGRSTTYQQPNLRELIDAVREAVGGRVAGVRGVGLCVPGIMDDATERVTLSVNVPGLNGVVLRDVVDAAFGDAGRGLPLVVGNDANATAHDLYTARGLTGRLLVLALGTGIGTAVVDPAGPLFVDGESPGHFGQMDVSLAGNEVIGPDGGAGSLEGYLGAEAMRRRYGPDLAAAMERVRVEDPPMRALVRAIRIGHAIYRPHHVCLAGGVGIRLGRLVPALRDACTLNLTRIARDEWTLTVADHDHHAALGAAKLAERACAAGDR